MTRGALDFEDFYRLRADSIVRALTVTLGDAELAADATNEAMIRAFQRWNKVSQYENPAAWVFRVGLNWSVSWKRRRKRERERPVRLGPATQRAIAVRDDSFDRALEGLSIDHRAVVVCRVLLDWSVDQTATALSVAPGTVKSRLARALGQLKKAMGEAEGASQ